MAKPKTGWDTRVCTGCAYRKHGKCVIAKVKLEYLSDCPENYTHELCREIYTDINKRIRGLPHGNVFSREW